MSSPLSPSFGSFGGVLAPSDDRGGWQYEGAQSLVTTSETFAGYAAPSRRKIESGYSA